jgi:NitT/TauT family transport system permease protein
VKPGHGSVWVWRVGILVVFLVAWEYLTGVKAISKMPGLYWIDPFFISRPSAIAHRFVFLMSDQVRLPLWRMALSTVQSTLWGFMVGITSGFVAGLLLGRSDKVARIFDPFIVAFNSLPRIALVPLITMVFGFGLLAKIVLAWSIVFFIVFFNTFQGARSVDADLISSARFLGAGERQILARSSCLRRSPGPSPPSRRPSPSPSSGWWWGSSSAGSREAASAISSSSRWARSMPPT